MKHNAGVGPRIKRRDDQRGETPPSPTACSLFLVCSAAPRGLLSLSESYDLARRLRSPRELLRVLLPSPSATPFSPSVPPPPSRARYTLFLSSGRVAARRATGIPCASVSTYLCPAETRIVHRALVTSRAESSWGTLKPFRSHRDRPTALSLLGRARRKCAPFFENERGHRANCIRCGHRGRRGIEVSAEIAKSARSNDVLN